MKKSGLILLASLMLIVLCSFSTPATTEIDKKAVSLVERQNLVVTTTIVATYGDGCLEIFMAWSDAVLGYVSAVPGSEAKVLYGATAAVLFVALMNCITITQ